MISWLSRWRPQPVIHGSYCHTDPWPCTLEKQLPGPLLTCSDADRCWQATLSKPAAAQPGCGCVVIRKMELSRLQENVSLLEGLYSLEPHRQQWIPHGDSLSPGVAAGQALWEGGSVWLWASAYVQWGQWETTAARTRSVYLQSSRADGDNKNFMISYLLSVFLQVFGNVFIIFSPFY